MISLFNIIVYTIQMSLINIRGKYDIVDDHYRYKMEKINITYQNNKGVTVIFNNIDAIAIALDRTPTEIIKFLKSYFGTSFVYKNNTASTTKKDLTSGD